MAKSSDVNVTQASDSVLNVTLTKIPKLELCPNPNIKQRKDEPSRLGAKSRKVQETETFGTKLNIHWESY